MGVVYVAHDRALDRRVALKVVLPKNGDELAPERFFREARAQAEVEQMKALVTAFAVGNVALSVLYAACLGLAAIHPEKRAIHDLLAGSRVVHVRSSSAMKEA